MQISWTEHATAVRSARGETMREIVAEGPLWRVLMRLDMLSATAVGETVIAFPDRRRPPYRLEAEAIRPLLLDRERPLDQSEAIGTTSAVLARSPADRLTARQRVPG